MDYCFYLVAIIVAMWLADKLYSHFFHQSSKKPHGFSFNQLMLDERTRKYLSKIANSDREAGRKEKLI